MVDFPASHVSFRRGVVFGGCHSLLVFRGVFDLKVRKLSYEKTPYDFPLYWLFNRDSYIPLGKVNGASATPMC